MNSVGVRILVIAVIHFHLVCAESFVAGQSSAIHSQLWGQDGQKWSDESRLTAPSTTPNAGASYRKSSCSINRKSHLLSSGSTRSAENRRASDLIWSRLPVGVEDIATASENGRTLRPLPEGAHVIERPTTLHPRHGMIAPSASTDAVCGSTRVIPPDLQQVIDS